MFLLYAHPLQKNEVLSKVRNKLKRAKTFCNDLKQPKMN